MKVLHYQEANPNSSTLLRIATITDTVAGHDCLWNHSDTEFVSVGEGSVLGLLQNKVLNRTD
jgi:hypothetical protein